MWSLDLCSQHCLGFCYNANSQTLSQTTKWETVGMWPNKLWFNKLSRWFWCTIKLKIELDQLDFFFSFQEFEVGYSKRISLLTVDWPVIIETERNGDTLWLGNTAFLLQLSDKLTQSFHLNEICLIPYSFQFPNEAQSYCYFSSQKKSNHIAILRFIWYSYLFYCHVSP